MERHHSSTTSIVFHEIRACSHSWSGRAIDAGADGYPYARLGELPAGASNAWYR